MSAPWPGSLESPIERSTQVSLESIPPVEPVEVGLYGPGTGEVPRLRRSWITALRLLPRLATYAANPFRLSAARAMSEFGCAIAAPRIQREFEDFARTPAGRERVQERCELSALLDDHKTLAALPEDSLGREYLALVCGAYMGGDGGEGTMSGAGSFLDHLHIDEAAERMGWPQAIVWYLRRITLTHDLTHVFTGYGTDNAGEFANIAYTIGHFRIHALVPVVIASMFAVKPAVGRRAWCRYLWAAYRRGLRQRERLSQLDYEALLPLPMAEVDRTSGHRSVRRRPPGRADRRRARLPEHQSADAADELKPICSPATASCSRLGRIASRRKLVRVTRIEECLAQPGPRAVPRRRRNPRRGSLRPYTAPYPVVPGRRAPRRAQ